MLLSDCWFTNALGGLVDWTYSGVAGGFQSPTVAGAVDGATYLYRAQTFDGTRWEVGTGAYTASSGKFARTTVLFNSAGTTAKINFPTPPHVVIQEAPSIAPTPLPAPTTQTFLSGSGTYTTPAGVKWIEVYLVGGGGGGGGGNNPTAASTGAATTFGGTLYSAGPGTGGTGSFPAVPGGGGTVTGSGTVVWGVIGGQGTSASQSVSAASNASGGAGGSSTLGGGGSGTQGAGGAGAVNTGAGGGGGGAGASASALQAGAGGGAGAALYAIINSLAATYAYSVGTGGAGSAGGAGASNGGAGASGRIWIIEHYGS